MTRYLKYYTQQWQRPRNQVAPSLVHVTTEMNAEMIADLEAITDNATIQESVAVTVTTGGEILLEINGTPVQTAAMTGKIGVRTDVMIAGSHHLHERLLEMDDKKGQETSPEVEKTNQESSLEGAMTDQERNPENDQNDHLQGVESVTDAAETATWQENAKLTHMWTAVPSTQARDHLRVVTNNEQAPEPRDSAALQSGSQTLQTTLQPALRPHPRLMTSPSHSPFLQRR